ncbi:uncharacterized protein BDFB_002480, partial [Asbolus verrucosus]
MSRKAFLVQVELDIQAVSDVPITYFSSVYLFKVTCPGVWLCSNGKVALQIYMLDSCVQTGSYKPNFPIQCNETFVFYKTFYSKHQLIELEKELHDQWVYIELVQWQSCEIGHVLATFQTTLDELLYPSTVSGSIAGVDLDLLMEPSKTFPVKMIRNCCFMLYPFHCLSREQSLRKWKKRHHFKPMKSKPPFRYRRAEDDLILRKPQHSREPYNNYCRQSRSVERRNVNSLRRRKPDLGECPCTVKMCSCGSGHRENFCPVCAKYKGYFSVTPAVTYSTELQQKDKIEDKTETPLRTTLFDSDKNCYRHSKTNRCPCCRPVAFAAAEGKSEATIEISPSDTEDEKKRVCFCNTERKPSLAERLHAKLTKTLSTIPKSIEWPCYDVNDDECDCCECPRQSRAELYRDLQKFYGDLYEKTRSNVLCVPDCSGYK